MPILPPRKQKVTTVVGNHRAVYAAGNIWQVRGNLIRDDVTETIQISRKQVETYKNNLQIHYMVSLHCCHERPWFSRGCKLRETYKWTGAQCGATYPPWPGSAKHSWRPPFLQLRRACLSSDLALTNFGSNPTNVGMYVYKPTTFTLAAKPEVLVVGIITKPTGHACTGNAQHAWQPLFL
ncbi:hypothetical protein GGX14DRAFT_406828 [Mycena pura]|uniref:Uncharacterized protein n=1 Tax=Mycena pura TaxID=153505 RepID=A0AAD6Y526_9AGAR|nr:hypothetical protein GGX14DRAFT_406828 [Mycena pura]